VVKKVALVLLVLVAVLAGLVAMQPAAYTVERAIEVRAPASVVIGHLASARAWEAWSPWHRIDPAMKLSYDGPESGPGSAYLWEGNAEVGKGKLTITAVTPDSSVETRLDFMAPMEGTARQRFTLEPVGELTRVTWHMEGTHNFIGKAFSLVMSMDGMIGSRFDEGLAALRDLAEAQAKAPSPAPVPEPQT
jgi:hypothetical protein